MRKMSSSKIATVFWGAAASLILLGATQSASAATLTSSFSNSLSTPVTASNISSGYSVSSSISSGGSGTGSQTVGTHANITASVSYKNTSDAGCYTTAQAAYNSATGRYTFASNASAVGVYMGQTATCSATITSSNSSTGNFSVSYTFTGF
jgi:hypothetical protein